MNNTTKKIRNWGFSSFYTFLTVLTIQYNPIPQKTADPFIINRFFFRIYLLPIKYSFHRVRP